MIRSSCLQKCNRIQLRNSASIVVFHKYLSSRKFRSAFVNTKFSSEFHNRNFSRTKTWTQLSGEQKVGNINANYKILDINAYFSLIMTYSICFILRPYSGILRKDMYVVSYIASRKFSPYIFNKYWCSTAIYRANSVLRLGLLYQKQINSKSSKA